MPYFDFEQRNIFYVDQGKGTPLLLLPGNTASSAVQASEIEYFSSSCRVICPDYPGYGKSDRVADLPEEFWWYNARLGAGLMQSLGFDRYISMGTSGGGIMALITAIIAGSSVRCVVADSICGEFPNAEDVRSEVRQRENPTDELRIFWQFAHGEDWRQVVELDSKMVLQAANSAESIYRGRLGEVKCPVLLTGSLADDAITNIEAGIGSIARKLDDAKAVLYSRGNHPLMWSKADQFRQEAIEFINNYID